MIPSYYILPVDSHKHCLKGYILTRCLNGRFVISPNGLVYTSHFRSDVKGCQSSEMEMTGGMNWQLNSCTCVSTIWSPISIPPVSHMVTFVMYYYVFSFLIYTYNIYICIREVGRPRNVLFLITFNILC